MIHFQLRQHWVEINGLLDKQVGIVTRSQHFHFKKEDCASISSNACRPILPVILK
jgi:hypothetical protein